jgi:hypothetical protein
LVLVFRIQSTYDSGDSLLHFIQAKLAFSHPALFLNHWAKPLFVLFAAPWAHFGWNGMQLFNACCMLSSAFLAFRTAIILRANGWIATLTCLFAVKFVLIQSSGLTEPLFTLFTFAIVYLESKNRSFGAAIIVSFLPFVRSEGWIVLLIYLVYVLINRQWKLLPTLLLGHALYGFLGQIGFRDFFWMFHQNPYLGVEEKYGHGDLLHFVIQLPEIVGLPVFVLFLVSLIYAGYRLITKKLNSLEVILIYGIPIGYFVSHTIFWRFGLFHSLGMTRVLIVLIPFIGLHIAILFREVQHNLKPLTYRILLGLTLPIVIIFPFTENKMAIDFKKDVKLEPSQQLVVEMYDWVKTTKQTLPRLWANDYYVPFVFNVDIYDVNRFIKISSIKSDKPLYNDWIVWDSYFSVTDSEVKKSDLMENPNLRLLKTFSNQSKKGLNELIVFEAIKGNLDR